MKQNVGTMLIMIQFMEQVLVITYMRPTVFNQNFIIVLLRVLDFTS